MRSLQGMRGQQSAMRRRQEQKEQKDPEGLHRKQAAASRRKPECQQSMPRQKDRQRHHEQRRRNGISGPEAVNRGKQRGPGKVSKSSGNGGSSRSRVCGYTSRSKWGRRVCGAGRNSRNRRTRKGSTASRRQSSCGSNSVSGQRRPVRSAETGRPPKKQPGARHAGFLLGRCAHLLLHAQHLRPQVEKYTSATAARSAWVW